jgi:hypothetical protein
MCHVGRGSDPRPTYRRTPLFNLLDFTNRDLSFKNILYGRAVDSLV